MTNNSTAPTCFDTVVHTCGEQALPILMGCLSVPAHRHLFLCSKKTAPLIPLICQEAGIPEMAATAVEVNPYDINGISKKLLAVLNNPTDRVCMNVTGGTKPMSIACLITALKHKWDAYYIDTTDRQIIWLTGNRGREPLLPLFHSIEPFIRLSGEHILAPEEATSRHTLDQRRELTNTIAHKLQSRINRLAQRLVRQRINESSGTSFTLQEGPITASLSTRQVASLATPVGDFTFPDMPDFAAYLAGGWFEEYCFWNLLHPLQRGEIHDLRLNLLTGNDQGKADGKSAPYQEIDLVFTDGYDLVLIECKSGSVKQEHVQKLENLTTRYGGVFGKGILVSVFSLHGTGPDRIRDSHNIACVCNHAVKKLSSHVLSVAPGDYIDGKPKKRRK